ncbi:MAG: hypothetical protein ACRD2O_12655 [Terriglobia bacterium]
MTGNNPASAEVQCQTTSTTGREADAIYQNNHLAARVEGAEVNPEAKTIHFDEIYNSDYLLLADECEYQQYRMMIRKIEYATKVEKTALRKGRTLRGVTAEILGYCEQ